MQTRISSHGKTKNRQDWTHTHIYRHEDSHPDILRETCRQKEWKTLAARNTLCTHTWILTYMYEAYASNLKAHANERNKCQQLPTLFGVVGKQCCVRLHRPKSLTSFKLYATSADIVVVPCKRTQQVTTLLGPTMLGPTILGVVSQQCWVRLHGP